MGKIQDKKPPLIEGELRCRELAEYLSKINAPKTVFLSEDGSGITKNVVYDTKTQQLVGLVLPLSIENGMPKSYSFIAKSQETIENLMMKDKSSLTYIIAAHPLKKNAPPFILQIYGTDNKFKTNDVLKRWAYVKSELKR